MPVTAGPWFSPVREWVSVANKSKNKSSSTTTNTNINTMEEEELNKNTNKNKKTPHLKTITTTTTTTTRQGGGMRITFSPSLLPKATATNNTNVDGEGATKTQGGYQEAGGLGGLRGAGLARRVGRASAALDPAAPHCAARRARSIVAPSSLQECSP